ncbi:MAG: serine/threonine-protein kinase [Pyrinomonadaceae bacterium]
MTPERWQQVEEVLQGALDRPPQDRASFLQQVCAGDSELKSEATSLVNAFDEAGDFIEQPAIAQDARVLIGVDPQSNLGREVGPYEIVKPLGAGGMGEVYLAQDSRLGRLVALKILPAYFASDDTRLRRFQREAQAASALNHPNILTIHEVGESEDGRFIATEFIDGQTIRELINQRQLALDDILDITEQVASGLSAAHAAGIVHRDIKPENIMRRTDGLVKILDFGIAKLLEPATNENARERSGSATQTELGLIMGTVNYMSPEQARGLPVDERTDIWSLGVVLYEMLAQRLPFAGATRMDTVVAILEREPLPLSQISGLTDPGSARLQHVIEKALRKNSDERYSSTVELLDDLRSLRGSDGVAADLPPGKRRVEVPSRRFYSGLAIVAALILAAIAGNFVYRRWIAISSAGSAHAPITGEASGKLYLQMTDSERLDFIDQQEQRISTMMGDRPVKLNEDALQAIKAHIDRSVDRDRRGLSGSQEGTLASVYGRAPTYVPLIARSFAARKVPVIIGIYLPVIESAYRECYENSIGAKGLFQFLPETARNYGVAHEDMCEVEKMAPAAAHYIADRMAELGEDSQSVTLVLLSYNRGPESVREMLRELRGTDNYERNFWTLFRHRDKLDDTFRNENAGYVPDFFAAAIIGENPRSFGLQIQPLSSYTGS